ncbi:CehA/McbA family metallohydrolase [Bacillus sp. FJAT-47783]|uniref:CehA/McbA family metallohydrolase n=1 Tax=Bacillus sp. FJAT-47783 TaxID=2922712 RepID=UPI001FAB66FF|nr:CehA/McbA family metallohydrolase [Bacillus sp. FJAT-47783]
MTTIHLNEVKGVFNTPFTFQTIHISKPCKWLKIHFEKEEKGWCELRIADPKGVVRAQALLLNERIEMVISDHYETSSYSTVPGPIQEGEWRMEMISMKSIPFTYHVEIGNNELPSLFPYEIEAFVSNQYEGEFALKAWNPNEEVQSETKWYKGDFHTHTNLSDGKLTVEEGMESARHMGLDFFVATDHNIIPTKWLKSDILVIPGVEITSTKGHFNALGVQKWVDWRPYGEDGGMESEKGMNRILKDVKDASGVRSINHPMLKPWDWQFTETLLEEVDVIEIWNDPTFKDNPKATEEVLHLWNKLLNDGYRIAGIGGSDSHMRPTEKYPGATVPSLIGDPATYVWAEGLSASSILNGIKRGSVYVTRFIDLKLDIRSDDREVLLGSEIEDDSIVQFTIELEKWGEECDIVWVQNGSILLKETIEPNKSYSYTANFVDSDFQWLRFEIRSKSGELLAFSNPIYKGKKTPTMKTWGELLN